MSTWWLGESELKDEQKAVFEIPPDESFLLLGPPGSGKTNILLLRANYLFLADHPNLKVIVFTKTLRQFIAMGAARYDFPASNIVTSTKWQYDLLNNHGITPPVFPPGMQFAERRFRLNKLINDELIAKRGLSGIFDAILLDEAHDYTPDEIRTFRALSKVFVASADTRQKIYRTADCMETLSNVTATTVTLTHHFRIGRKICRVADAIGRGIPDYATMLDSCQYDEERYPSDVLAARSGDIDAQAQAVISAIGLQLDAYPDEMIGVLAPRHEQAGRVYDALSSSPYADITIRHTQGEHPEFTDETRICVTSIHSAKGLEFRAVHIVDADQLEHEAIKLSFTGLTRAKSIATFHYDRSLPGFIDSAIREIQPPRPLPALGTLFGGRTRR